MEEEFKITCSLLIYGGDIKTVQGDSGHSQINMVTDVYSHIIDDDRRKNVELFEQAFYEKKNLDPSMHAHVAGKTVELPTDVDAELLAKVLSNPEMATLLTADVVVWATPIYYSEMPGQMKVLIDRMNPMFSKNYKFREVYFLATAAEDEEYVYEKALSGLIGWIDCFERAELAGHLFCGGVTMDGEINGNPKIQKAYDMGAGIAHT